MRSPSVSRCLVVDSSSTDDTVAIAREFGAEVVIIPQREFNHGQTREFARRRLGTDVVVMLTQDAILEEPEAIEHLIAPIVTHTADVSYGRQLPKPGATLWEAFVRDYNYPAHPQLRRLGDVERYGVYTFFCSDSFAAYRQSALDAAGGFDSAFTSEEYFAVARILLNGGAIAYTPEARVYHSHRYTLLQEFRRNFDTGYVRGERRWVKQYAGRAERRGAEMTKALLRTVLRRCPHHLPYVTAQTLAKLAGYRLGYHSQRLPLGVKRLLSGQPYHWRSDYAKGSADLLRPVVRAAVLSPDA